IHGNSFLDSSVATSGIGVCAPSLKGVQDRAKADDTPLNNLLVTWLVDSRKIQAKEEQSQQEHSQCGSEDTSPSPCETGTPNHDSGDSIELQTVTQSYFRIGVSVKPDLHQSGKPDTDGGNQICHQFDASDGNTAQSSRFPV